MSIRSSGTAVFNRTAVHVDIAYNYAVSGGSAERANAQPNTANSRIC